MLVSIWSFTIMPLLTEIPAAWANDILGLIPAETRIKLLSMTFPSFNSSIFILPASFLDARSKSIKDAGNIKILELKDGKVIESNFILVSAGISPNIALAQAAGISVNKGIIVNDHMETSIPNIYAAGDAAEHKGRIYGIWPAAQRQGVIAGINMAGGSETYAGTVPSTTLKVAGIHLTSIGDVLTEDKTVEQVKKINPEKNMYKKLFIKEGRLVGAIFLGDAKNVHEIGMLMEKKPDVTRYKEKILEADFDVKGLLK